MSKINPRKLLPHPFNAKVYGEEALDADFIKSIREKGVLEPVIVTSATINGEEGQYILSGHRRTQAAKEIGIDVPYRIEVNQGPLWQESFLLEVNRQRVKTPEQKTREYNELVRIEKELADQRRAKGIRLPGTASERAAAKVGVEDAWARRMAFVVTAADEGNATAAEGLARINSGEVTPETIYRAIQPRTENTTAQHYSNVARSLQESIGFFNVLYTPQVSDPKHGFVFKAKFICEEEAQAFIKLFAAIPPEAMDEFVRVSKSWRK